MSQAQHNDNLILERLFTSRVRVRLLTIFLLRPENQYHIRALASEVDAQYSAVWKELNNLEKIGFLQSESTGGRKIFRMNARFPIIKELRHIFLKTVGVGDLVRNSLIEMDGIEKAFIFGSFADGDIDADSDLDLMIIGEIEVAHITPVVEEIEKILTRDVNYLLVTQEEWEIRLAEGDSFSSNIQDSPKIMLIGNQNGV